MRYQDALLLEKKHAEDKERQMEAQIKLEKVASVVDNHFTYWLQYRDPFAESDSRINELKKRLSRESAPSQPDSNNTQESNSNSSSHSAGGAAGSFRSTLRRALHLGGGSTSPRESTTESMDAVPDVVVKHANEQADLNPTAFKLYRKLRFG